MIRQIIRGFLFTLLGLSLFGLAWMYIFRPYATNSEAQKLKTKYALGIPGADGSGDAPSQSQNVLPLVDLAALQVRYPDLQGWLCIPGTGVDYPVMQSGLDQPEYYLRRDHGGKLRSAGSLFFQADCTPESRNLVIYGHNLGDGTMFGSLAKMRDASYRDAHFTVWLQTQTGVTVFRIVSAQTVDAAHFPFNRTQFENDRDFLLFAADMVSCAQYAPRADRHAPRADRQLLTLVTCPDPYLSSDQRLIIVAVSV